jgi:hypothetical protein
VAIPTEFIEFERQTVEGRKTPIVFIRSKSSGIILGEIKWHGAWRQFAFFPHGHTIWNPACMTSVMEKISELMLERVQA